MHKKNSPDRLGTHRRVDLSNARRSGRAEDRCNAIGAAVFPLRIPFSDRLPGRLDAR